MLPVEQPKAWYEKVFAPFRFLWRLLGDLEKAFYKVRDLLWNYPDTLFFGEQSVSRLGYKLYKYFSPVSYLLFAVFAFILFAIIYSQFVANQVLAKENSTLVEGVVMGVDETGLVQKLSKVNPLVPSNIQLEKDLSELIYEPLIRYQQNGEIVNVLANNIIRRQEGAEYIFELRDDVYWHDGEKFEVDDVVATLNLMQQLSENEELSENAYIKAIDQMGWEIVGKDSIAICTLDQSDLSKFKNGEIERPCTDTTGQKPILSNFLELIAVRIMPAHLIGELNVLNINQPEPFINRSPVGTGPFVFKGSEDDEIYLEFNELYREDPGQIQQITFKLFRTEDEALYSLETGGIHSVVSPSTINLEEVGNYPNLTLHTSEVLTYQYWGLYFNLRKNPDGDPLGPAFLSDLKVRRAISLAIDKQKIVSDVLTVGEVATGPIHSSSEFYNADISRLGFNTERAKRLLEDAGWVRGNDGVLAKDGTRLSFKLAYVDNYDREQTVNSIVEDLRQVGIEVIPDPKQPKEMVNEVVSSKTFDTLLYGMRTFIDPDRYELFHSKEMSLSNLSSYVGRSETVKIENGEKVNLPKVDRLLEVGRSLDPLSAKDERLTVYYEFQEEIAKDVPLVFLYHPQFLYYTQNDLQNLNLENADAIEERFANILTWQLN